ncbi:ABC transporter ATP-binding protein [Gracilibacillus alcaliphilus]|uniref:ABC transporter ATP-binding protein n=1 Tax=Gracilibacillus alcaliphilus TaxID=1401441 RepID=UPI001957140B|nr:ABC transporter ATP-binding protein [Gracilibacillus alcaliphilus]MBM7676510.1 ABC-2 type transport system ATP-binding protein [Gracilibacillus alcaliphilus]
MTVLQLDRISKQFGQFQALNQVSMELKQGEIYGFIGPNGAGKSTTIRIILGMLQATSGSATLFGKDVWRDAAEVHKRCAYVPGDVNVWPNLTGGEVIDVLLKMNGIYDKKKRDHWIERLQFDPSKKSRSYSKGNRQKIALIAAFASNADLFILDEPTSGLDPLMEHVFQQGVQEVKDNGKTVLLSSHILSEVEKLCDRVAIIRQGEIIEQGSLKDMRHLTRMHIMVETRYPLHELEQYKGIYDVEEQGNILHFQMDAEQTEPVMQYLSQQGIIRLESSPPKLEDLFMRHYEQKGGR